MDSVLSTNEVLPLSPSFSRLLSLPVLYRVLFHHFDRFLTEYESRFEWEYRLCSPQARSE